MPRRSDEPFPVALQKLLDEREWTQRELSRRTSKELGWGSHTAIALLLRGELEPTTEAMEAVAKVMRLSPSFFPEYRMAKARDQVDPRVVGFRRALRNLSE